MTRREPQPDPKPARTRTVYVTSGGNRRERRARGWRDSVTGRLLSEPAVNRPYRKDNT